MLTSGKICRFLALVMVAILLGSEVHALEIRFSNPFARGSGLFSFRDQPTEADEPREKIETEPAAGVLPEQRVVRAANYLQASRSPQVAFVTFSDKAEMAPSPPSEKVGARGDFPRFSDFLKLLEADLEKTVTEKSGETASREEDSEKVGGTTGEEKELTASAETESDLSLETQPSPTFEILSGGHPGDRLFRRQAVQEGDFGHIFFFFPSEAFDFESGGNYAPAESAGRFNHFTPPAQPLPRSSARFRSVP